MGTSGRIGKPLGWGTLIFTLLVAGGEVARGADSPPPAQEETEESVQTVVRHKHYYKGGKIELTATVGQTPFSSLVSQTLAGGRLLWHMSDHWGWEIVDAQAVFPTLSGYTTTIVSQQGISNLQTTKLHGLVGTDIVASPFYGKLRLWGRSVIHFDMYFVAGGGLAQVEMVQVAASQPGATATVNTIQQSWDPMLDLGLGLKVFLSDRFALILDLRDYLTDSLFYGQKSLNSNFSIVMGLSFYIPGF